MDITVIVCTHNRYQSLAKALDSVAASMLPEFITWEVLVVDNNSNDGTRGVVEDFCHRYGSRFRYLFEPQPGKSHALNAGIHEAHGDILAFLDDDVTVEPSWLRNLTAALASDGWAGSGGRILPAQSFSPPNWLSVDEPYNWGPVLAGLFDLGDEPCELGLAPHGTNMAFRKAVFEKYGDFRVDLGPSPGSEIRNEDTEFGRRLMTAGERLRYEPFAVVYHPVLEHRVRRDYFLTWWFDYGRSVVREEGKPPCVWSIPARIGVQLLVRTLRWMRSLNPARRFFWKCRVWMTAGQIVEIYRQ